MKIKWGSIVVNGSGKLGGHVYSKNRGGNYVRTLATPSNPQTPFQQAGRAVFSGLTQGWSALSNTQRETWNNAVSNFERTDQFGDVRQLSGKGLYISLNKELLLVGKSQLTVAPTPGPIQFVPDYTPVLSTSAGTVDFGNPAITLSEGLVYAVTPVLTQGTSFVKNKLRIMSAQLDGKDDAFLHDVIIDRYGPVPVGARMAVKLYYVNDAGQRSPGLTKFFDVV